MICKKKMKSDDLIKEIEAETQAITSYALAKKALLIAVGLILVLFALVSGVIPMGGGMVIMLLAVPIALFCLMGVSIAALCTGISSLTHKVYEERKKAIFGVVVGGLIAIATVWLYLGSGSLFAALG